MELVRTEPRDLAPVIPLPVRRHPHRIIRPVDVAPGTPLDGAGDSDLRLAPGPLARALLDVQDRADH
jgi:hypothetical protein